MRLINIRQATSNDLGIILQLFRETIESVNAKDYSPDQIEVWANGAEKREKWLEKISQQYFLLAEIDSILVGFGSMTIDGYLDFMYVSKDYQRKGIAQKIYDELEKFAITNRLDKIVSDASITAKPFFERNGFIIIQEQQVSIDGIKLTNYKMQKHLELQ